MAQKIQSQTFETLYLLTYEEIEQFESLIYKLRESYWEIMDRRRVVIPSLHGESRIGPATRALHEAFSDIAEKKERTDEYQAHLENIKKNIISNKMSKEEIDF
jgi:hypothetical protein